MLEILCFGVTQPKLHFVIFGFLPIFKRHVGASTVANVDHTAVNYSTIVYYRLGKPQVLDSFLHYPARSVNMGDDAFFLIFKKDVGASPVANFHQTALNGSTIGYCKLTKYRVLCSLLSEPVNMVTLSMFALWFDFSKCMSG